MADAAHLADDDVGRRERSVDTMQAFFPPTIVMDETPTVLFDHLAIRVDRPGPASHAQDAFAEQRFRARRIEYLIVRFGNRILAEDFDGLFGKGGEIAQPHHFPLKLLLTITCGEQARLRFLETRQQTFAIIQVRQ